MEGYILSRLIATACLGLALWLVSLLWAIYCAHKDRMRTAHLFSFIGGMYSPFMMGMPLIVYFNIFPNLTVPTLFLTGISMALVAGLPWFVAERLHKAKYPIPVWHQDSIYPRPRASVAKTPVSKTLTP